MTVAHDKCQLPTTTMRRQLKLVQARTLGSCRSPWCHLGGCRLLLCHCLLRLRLLNPCPLLSLPLSSRLRWGRWGRSRSCHMVLLLLLLLSVALSSGCSKQLLQVGVEALQRRLGRWGLCRSSFTGLRS